MVFIGVNNKTSQILEQWEKEKKRAVRHLRITNGIMLGVYCLIIGLVSLACSFIIIPLVKLFTTDFLGQSFRPVSVITVWVWMTVLVLVGLRPWRFVEQEKLVKASYEMLQVIYMKRKDLDMSPFGISYIPDEEEETLFCHGKSYKSKEEMLTALNKLVLYMIGDDRRVELKDGYIPVIFHDGKTEEEGVFGSYTYKDLMFEKFVRYYLKEYYQGKYKFIDVDYFISHTEKTETEDRNLKDVLVDDIF